MAERRGPLYAFIIAALITVPMTAIAYLDLSHQSWIEGDWGDTSPYGGQSTREVPFLEDAESVTISWEVEASQRFDVYLTQEKVDMSPFPWDEPEHIRHGIVGNDRSVEWVVDREEFGPNGRLFIIFDNTDQGDVPVAPGGVEYRESIGFTTHYAPLSRAGVWIAVVAWVVLALIGVYLYRVSRTEPEEFSQESRPLWVNEPDGPRR